MGTTFNRGDFSARAKARALSAFLQKAVKPGKALSEWVKVANGDQAIVGIGQPAVVALKKNLVGLRTFPTNFGAELDK